MHFCLCIDSQKQKENNYTLVFKCFKMLYSDPQCSKIFHNGLQRSTLLYNDSHCFTLLCSTVIHTGLKYFIMLYTVQHCYTLIYNALLYSDTHWSKNCFTLLYSDPHCYTLFHTGLHCFTLFYSDPNVL